MGQAERSLFDMLGDARARLRERTLPALAAALVLQVRLASATDRFELRALSSAFGILVLLLLALVAATADALAAVVASSAREVMGLRVRFGPAPAPIVTLPPAIGEEMLLDKRGRPLRGAPRARRLAALERDRAARIAAESAIHAGSDQRVIELPPLPAGLVAAYARGRHAALAASATLRRVSAAVGTRTAAAAAVVPVPALPIRWVRIIATTTAMTFVFATAIGTTGIITQQGRIALGASTTLTIIAGDVSAQQPGSSELRPVADGALLRAGMTIHTGEGSYAILTYFEGSTVSLEPNTTLLIEQLVANADGSTVISMQQQLGRTWHSVTKLLGQGSKYEVKTPTLTATVRGTAFEVGVAQAATGEVVASIVTTEGAVGAFKPATAADPAPAEVVVPAGFQTQATQAAPIAPPEPAPEPERKVTVTVGTANAVVVDPLGRANGEKDGKLVLQTPGAKVQKVGGKLVVTLPNVPDGRISTVIASTAQAATPVAVETVVADRGKPATRSDETVQVPSGATAPAVVTGVEVKAGDAGQAAGLRILAPSETRAAPAPKVVDPPKTTPRPQLIPSPEPKEPPKQDADGDSKDGEKKKVSGVVDLFVKSTLPPLSIEDAARRAEEARKAEERAKQDAEKREEERRRENERRVAEARKAEERAREEAAKVAEERRRAEDKAREEAAKRERSARSVQEQGGQAAPAPATFVENILRAIAPSAEDDARRRAEDLRKAEERARDEAAKVSGERRKAEAVARNDDIKRAEAERQQAEKRAEELRKAEEKAREGVAKELERIREIEQKAREQAQRLEADKRAQAEKLVQEFRQAEEKAREDAAKRLEEQRKAEERAKEEAEKRLEQLREAEKTAREEARKAEDERREREERQRQEKASRDRRESNFVPPTIDPFPGTLGSGGQRGSGRGGSNQP